MGDGGQEAIVAAARATRTIPIIVFEVVDPVEQGASSRSRNRGRNVAGVSLSRGPALARKRLQYRRAIARSAKRLCSFWGHDTSLATRVDGSRYEVAASLAAAVKSLQFETRLYRVAGPAEIDRALADAAAWRAEALTSSDLPPFLARREIARFALRERLPSAFAGAEFVEAGGLLSYAVAAAEVDALTMRWIVHVDRALRGASPADLPVLSADRYELQINTTAAATLGLAIRQSLLSRADAVR
ncbi:MAG: hypothetical protein JO090_15555 [Rhizobacter sp.]|nr:hypothetical protein [Rhizobacter sp.]